MLLNSIAGLGHTPAQLTQHADHGAGPPRVTTSEGARGSQVWLTAEQFFYTQLADDSALLRLAGRLQTGCKAPEQAALVISWADLEASYRGWPSVALEHRRLPPRRKAKPVLWRASFEVPLHVVEYSDAVFTVVADDHGLVALAAPCLGMPSKGWPCGPREPSLARQARRHAIALAAGLAAAAAMSAGAIASASTTPLPYEPTATTLTAVSTPPATIATTAVSTSTTVTAAPTAITATSGAATTAPAPSTDTPSGTPTTPPAPPIDPPSGTSTTPPAPSPPDSVITSDTPTEAGPSATTGAAPAVTQVPAPLTAPPAPPPQASPAAPSTVPVAPGRGRGQRQVSAKPSGSKHHRNQAHRPPHRGTIPTRRSGPTARPPARSTPLGPGWTTGRPSGGTTRPLDSVASDPLTVDPFTTAQIKHFELLGGSLDQPPAFLVPIYKAAGRRYHVPWQILAAINAIETNYGENLNVSVAGAIGWMQFEPSTWFAYGVRVDGAGQPNPYDPKDAIFSAARYLEANGAPQHMREAIFAYNHALWYVDAVLWRAQLIGARSLRSLGHRSGYELPLDARFMHTVGRTDDGVDIETAPDGAAVYSIAPGVVTAVASDPGGFGPNYPVILVTAGPLAGQCIYYGHVAASLVHPGDHVLAGQPIAVMGHTGDAASLGHGHIEIGFSDGSGDPLNHHSVVDAWTPAGAAMRHVLEAIRAKVIRRNR
jgi:hypothetical protein